MQSIEARGKTAGRKPFLESKEAQEPPDKRVRAAPRHQSHASEQHGGEQPRIVNEPAAIAHLESVAVKQAGQMPRRRRVPELKRGHSQAGGQAQQRIERVPGIIQRDNQGAAGLERGAELVERAEELGARVEMIERRGGNDEVQRLPAHRQASHIAHQPPQRPRPGAVAGDRIDRVIAAKAKAQGVPVETMRKHYVETASMKRLISPEDIANMILFLCSDAGRLVSGQVIGVDGNAEYLR